MKIRFVILTALCVWGLAAAADFERFPMPSPPAQAQVTKAGGQNFYSGLVYLEVGSDTTLLASLGFRKFEFQGRSVNSVRYHAYWPESAVKDSVPAFVSGVEYDLTTNPDRVAAPPDLGLPDDLDLSPDSDTPADNGSGE